MSKNVLKPYYNKLIGEGLLRAVFCGLIIGFSAVLVSALVCWYLSFKAFWLTIVIGVSATAVATVLFYFLKYRPNIKQISARIDELGLEERILTMNELKDDDSYIAKRQREDAMSALSKVTASNIAVTVALSLLLVMPIVAVVSAGASTVYGLHVAGIIPSGRDVFFQIIQPELKDVEIQFVGDGGGSVGGYTTQTIKEGANADAVVAIPEPGYAFSHWTWIEGSSVKFSTTPYFVAEEVFEDTKFTAVFTQLENYEDQPGGLESGGKGNGKGQNGNQNGPTSDTDMPPSEDEQNQPGDPSDDMGSGGSGAGANDEENKILDGDTFYGDIYEGERNDAMQNVSQDKEMSQEMKDFIEGYYDAINQQKSEGEE